MSDTTIAILIVPFLAVLTVVLECTRIGCIRLGRKLRRAKAELRESAEFQAETLHW